MRRRLGAASLAGSEHMRPPTLAGTLAGLSSESTYQAERQKLLGEMWQESILEEDAKVEAGREAGSITPSACGQGAARAWAPASPAAGRSLTVPLTLPSLSAGSEHSTPPQEKRRCLLTHARKDTLEARKLERIRENNGGLFFLGRTELEVPDAGLMTELHDRLHGGHELAQVEPRVEPETASSMTTVHVISHEKVQVQLEAVYYSSTTGMLHPKRGGGSERHLSDHGQVGMTPGQKALHVARQRMEISRTDAEMFQAVHTLALALGANRTEAGTYKALFAALVLLNRPEMSEEEVCASTGASLNSCKKWRRKVLDAQVGLPPH